MSCSRRWQAGNGGRKRRRFLHVDEGAESLFFLPDKKKPGKRPRHLEAFLVENQVPFYHGQLGNSSAYESIQALAELTIWDIGQFL